MVTKEMIDRSEIDAVGKSLGVNTANVQRDYVFGWILAGIYRETTMGADLVLKGGNCFRKAYFPLGRFSNDLDFSCGHQIDQSRLRESIANVAEHARDRAGIQFDLDRTLIKEGEAIDVERSATKVRLYFKDFYGKPSELVISVRLDITEFDRMHLAVAERPLIHNYSDSALCAATVRCWQLEEMLAAKLKCLVQRQHLVDLFDLVHSVFVNRDIEVNRVQVASVFLKKTIFGRSPAAAKTLLMEIPLDFAKASWRKYVVCPLASFFDFEMAESRLRELVGTLFGDFGGFHGERAFYPPAYRVKIMQAGREKSLMRFGYDGAVRIIEPYALNCKVRKDGVGQEYLFAYDRTGGSSGPGMKTFLHGKISELEILSETFEPRYEVELAKAGEYPDQVTFADPNRSATISRGTGRRRSSATSARYTVACPYCGKRFKRQRMSTRLNPHKNAWGSKCPGRTGYLV